MIVNCHHDARFTGADTRARTAATTLRTGNIDRPRAFVRCDRGEIRSSVPRGRIIGLLALAAVLCAGCETGPSIEGDQTTVRQGERRDQFMCRDGVPVELRIFDTRDAAVLIRNGRTVRLKLQSTESGDIYSNGPTTVRRKGRDLRLQFEGADPIECRAQSSD